MIDIAVEENQDESPKGSSAARGYKTVKAVNIKKSNHDNLKALAKKRGQKITQLWMELALSALNAALAERPVEERMKEVEGQNKQLQEDLKELKSTLDMLLRASKENQQANFPKAKEGGG